MVSNAFSFACFPCLGVFRSYFLFLCHWISFVCFLRYRSICTHSPDPLFLTLGEFQAFDWLSLALVSTDLWFQRRTIGMRMEQKSRFKFLPCPGFEPQTSRFAVQHTTSRPPRTSTADARELFDTS